jgi:hypothetical protein
VLPHCVPCLDSLHCGRMLLQRYNGRGEQKKETH